MGRSSELLKRLCLLACRSPHFTHRASRPRWAKRCPRFPRRTRRSGSGSRIDHGPQRRHAGLFPFCGLVTFL